MKENTNLEKLKAGLNTAFVDYANNSSLAYRPEFISNSYQNGKKVLSSLEYELLHCDAFSISVAFIKMSGIEPLLQVFKQLENRGVPGRILTTDYLTFSEPEAFDKLNSLNNIKLKMYQTEGEKDGFHTKGYIFKDGKIYRIIVGSSNLTSSAITINQEWNTKLVSSEDGSIAKDIVSEFDRLWNSERALDYNEFIADYRVRYKIKKEQQKLAKESEVISIEKYKLEPNSMQVKFIENVMEFYENGENRALEEKLLCPFHYFGITDLEVDGHIIDDNAIKNVQNFTNLVCDDRVNYIMQQMDYYGYSGDKVKGLMFCRNKDEAEQLSAKFNMRGLRTLVLTGDNSQREREEAILRLEQDESENALDYIITVDIFNEGVEVVERNNKKCRIYAA
mgnify:FL=1